MSERLIHGLVATGIEPKALQVIDRSTDLQKNPNIVQMVPLKQFDLIYPGRCGALKESTEPSAHS